MLLRHSLLITAIVTLFNFNILAQTTSQKTAVIKGRLKEEKGSVVSFATIRITGTNIATFSETDGTFLLKEVPYGNQEIVITSVEIKAKAFKFNVDKPYHEISPVVAKTALDLNEVQIVEKTEKKQIETQGFAVAVIETKEASLRNLTTNELLDRAVGVRVRQNGGIGSRVEYNLNGMSGSAVGIFLDGIEIATYGSSFNLNNIPPAMIERIEVYKGVLPSHLTGDYVGGAINVVLKKDASQNNITAAVAYGSFNTFQSDLSGIYRNKKSGFTTRASGFYTYTDNSYTTWGKFSKFVHPDRTLERYYKAKRFNNTYKSIGARFEVGFTNVKWADQFFLGYNISDTYSEIPHGTTMAKPYVGRFGEYQAHVVSLNYNKNNFLAKGLAVNVNAVRSYRSTYVQDTVGQVYNWDGRPRMLIRNGVEIPVPPTAGMGQQGPKSIVQVNRQITNMRTNLGYTVAPGHRVSLNHKLETTDRDDNDLLNPVNKDLVTVSNVMNNIFAMNYEAQLLNDKLRTNLLAKYTFNRTIHTRPELVEQDGANIINRIRNKTVNNNKGYGATVSYNVVSKMYVIGSTENSYVAATENQLYGDPENNILESPGLIPEKNVNYNLGVRHGPIQRGKHKITLYASAFWRNGFDKITQQAVEDQIVQGRESDADIQVTKYVNLGRTQSRGFEGEIIYIYDNRLNALFNFSKFNTLFKQKFDQQGNPHDLYNLQLPNEPFFTMNGSFQYRLNDKFQKKSILNIYYNTGFVGAFRTVWMDSEWFTTPTQFYHDIGASYRLPSGKLVVSFDLKNILNAEMYDNFGVQKPGRAISIKLNYTISKFL
ncbi:TonB-dependent receptor [Dyadobacter psychrophilus]|uniref:Outer membrane receptor proteins, mostly Fe transport n=1 Tax=Dyadobacter psychrophilus TaxID=651661 RepID=A0A1T5DAK5_9BACT|nr:TonB-dependent receptor plug domain-containing protein [Dyadobacter psychrophilus]SKB68705.1 Outer membrane receptor proteins, mostly Fe transport [Dyadobacter psychrophilus]